MLETCDVEERPCDLTFPSSRTSATSTARALQEQDQPSTSSCLCLSVVAFPFFAFFLFRKFFIANISQKMRLCVGNFETFDKTIKSCRQFVTISW